MAPFVPRKLLGCGTENMGFQYCDNCHLEPASKECEENRMWSDAKASYQIPRRDIPSQLTQEQKRLVEKLKGATTDAEIYGIAGVEVACDIRREESA